jgi:hypothetical protein
MNSEVLISQLKEQEKLVQQHLLIRMMDDINESFSDKSLKEVAEIRNFIESYYHELNEDY